MREETIAANHERLRAAAGDDSQLYAVLDGAAMIPDIVQRLRQYAIKSGCLLPGEVDSELRRVAPHLAHLNEQPAFLEWLLKEGLGKHWGVFLVTPAAFQTLRQHLQTPLHVYSPDSEPLLFRFYDPRVLRAYLPTCEDQQLAQFFGPISCFLAERDDSMMLEIFELREGALHRR
ncbi:DUF4123 domain-containing protein [Halochromatium glycolicum]|uniref:DUF4123 domain-containing protein n=1 Tax=Halochromatium glycolicum TaxID=85075 RepID=A0AAJ0U5B9_9GAMM|nr:DUF4123 domain-containing protein [Halochromatium glycolicum]MBK1705564.1 hypothetical protein [Halochromatium glycolicum]